MKLANTLPLTSTNILDEYPYPRPKGIPDNWVIHPHNNPNISLISKNDEKTGKKWIPNIRENWINPEALKDVCKRIGCDGVKGHDRKPNSYHVDECNERVEENKD